MTYLYKLTYMRFIHENVRTNDSIHLGLGM